MTVVTRMHVEVLEDGMDVFGGQLDAFVWARLRS